MRDLLAKITDNLLQNRSVAIIGPSQSGKSYWVKNTLIPKLSELGKSIFYAEDGDVKVEESDIIIFDEVETLFDQKVLEAKHPEEQPYYFPSYLEKVKRWHANYASHPETTVYIISRNKDDVEFLVNNFTHSDWDSRPLTPYRFSNSHE